MAKLSEKQLIAVTLALTLIPTLVVAYFIYKDYQHYQDLRLQIEQKTAEITRKNKDIEKIPDIKRNLDERAADFLEHVKILPSAEELENFTRNLSDTAAKANVEHMETIAPGRATAVGRARGATGNFDEYNYSLSFSCDYKQLADFYHALESNKRFIKVHDFTITPSKTAEGAILNVDTDVKTYMYTKAVEKDQPYDPVPQPGRPSPEPEEPALLDSYIQKPSWKDPFRSVLRQVAKEREGGEGGGQAVEPPVGPKPTAVEEQARELESLKRRLRLVHAAYTDKKFSEILQLLDGFEEAWKKRPTFTDSALETEAEEVHQAFVDVRQVVMGEMEFIVSWAELRLDEIRRQFEVADKSNQAQDLERVVATQQAMDESLTKYSVDLENVDISSIREQAQVFSRRAATRLEFSELALRVVGLAYHFDPELRDRSRAVIEYEGETLDLDRYENEIYRNRDLKLDQVKEDGVVFSYKGELILKPLDLDENTQDQMAGGRTQASGRGWR